MPGIHRLLYGMLAGGGSSRVGSLLPPPVSSLLDARSPYSGNVNFDTEVRSQPAAYANAILSAAAATLPPPAHWTSIREATYAVSTDNGAFVPRAISDADWAWLRNFPTYAACVGRDLLLELLPHFVESRTRDAGPTPDALFETMASRAAKGVSKPHLYCWEYFLRWEVAEMVRLAYALEAGGIKISGWLIINEPDANAPQNARLSRGPGLLDYDVAHISTGTRGPYAFAFAVTDAADIEVPDYASFSACRGVVQIRNT